MPKIYLLALLMALAGGAGSRPTHAACKWRAWGC